MTDRSGYDFRPTPAMARPSFSIGQIGSNVRRFACPSCGAAVATTHRRVKRCAACQQAADQRAQAKAYQKLKAQRRARTEARNAK